MKYRLLALDLDGTLLASDGSIPPANVRALRRAQEAGLMIVLCTGRGLKETQPAIRALGGAAPPGPLVLANGALISDQATGRTLHRACIEPHVSRAVIEHLARGDDAVLVLLDPFEVDHDYLVVHPDKLTANTLWWFQYVGATYRGTDRPTDDDLHHAVRVGIVGPASHMPPVQRSLEERFGSQLFVQHFMAVAESDEAGEPIHVLEVFVEGVSKWSALCWVAGEHGIEPSQIAAIGDHVNDVQMVQQAGCGIAMGNAVQQVCRVARRQTATNDQAGVAQAIDRILDGSW